MQKSDAACHLCGLPVGNSRISQPAPGGTVRFCCPGCMYVFQIFFNSPEGLPKEYKETELYRACVSAGLIPSADGARADAGREAGGAAAEIPLSPEMIAIQEGLSRELSVKIEGMWCVACSWLIEQLLRKMDGIINASIFFFSDVARIKYMPHRIQPQQITDAISRLGYRAAPVEDGAGSVESRSLMVRLGIAGILSMNIMMISFALYFGFLEDIGRQGAAYFSYPLWVLATPVVFWCGLPILRRAFWGVRYRTATMDLLIAVGVLAAYFYSVVQLFRGSLHVYFDTASMLVTLVLLGRFIELRAREKIAAGITALFHAAGGKVRLVRNGREIWTASDKVAPGDAFVVFPGERIPVDGYILSGKAVLDESIITGESRPVTRMPGADAPAGALLIAGDAKFEVTRPAGESSLSQIITLIQEALSTKNRLELFADRAMRVLVPAVLLLAASAALLLMLRSVPPDEALLRTLSILLITCPCALGIATPLARVAAIAKARSSGILIRNPAALECVDDLRAIVFDKTGTITEGEYALRRIVALDGTEDDALRRVASAEARSDHFLAREIVRAARERSLVLEDVPRFEPLEGLGIIARDGQGEIFVGNRTLMDRQGIEFPEGLEDRASAFQDEGATVVFFAWSSLVKGFFVFGDKIRENASEVISRFQAAGVSAWLVSGDSKATTESVARRLGIEHYAGQALPGEKVEIIKDLQARGFRVAMAGDGINDAAALARADIGITVGSGANLIRECSDAAIFGDDLLKIPELVSLSRFTFRIIRQNLFFAFFYNLFGIPLAAAGALNPLVAAVAMFASSATVVFNTLRISRFGSNTEGPGN